MTSPVILAIDQGTTSSRCVVYDAASFAVLGSAQQEIGQHYPNDGWVEHEPEDIWYSVARTVREALAKAGRAPKSVAVSRASCCGAYRSWNAPISDSSDAPHDRWAVGRQLGE